MRIPLATALALVPVAVFAQERFGIMTAAAGGGEAGVVQTGVMPAQTIAAGPVNVGYVSAIGVEGGKIIKNAPYSAEFSSEFVQTLADGNVIRHKQTGNTYRDSDGRTRREQTLTALGPLAMGANPAQLVFVNDPVAGVNYVLDANRKTAQKMPALPPKFESMPTLTVAAPAGQAATTKMFQTMDTTSQESLGTKLIAGVQAEGTRTLTTIPAGQIGNERPIQIVTERWYAPQLQMVVMTKNTDPRMGENTYQLTNINLSEPQHSLFEVPPDYQVIEGPAKDVKFIVRGPGGKTERAEKPE